MYYNTRIFSFHKIKFIVFNYGMTDNLIIALQLKFHNL